MTPHHPEMRYAFITAPLTSLHLPHDACIGEVELYICVLVYTYVVHFMYVLSTCNIYLHKFICTLCVGEYVFALCPSL